MMNKAKILCIDDDIQVLMALKALFKRKYEVFTAESGEEGINIIKQQLVMKSTINVVVCDQRMPGLMGVEVLKQIKEISPSTIRILLTGYSDQETLIGTINKGEVFRFIQKPWDNDELRFAIDIAVDISQKVNNAASSPVSQEEVDSKTFYVLVLDDLNDTAKELKTVIDDNVKVYHANTFERANDILDQHEIAILIFDVVVDNKFTTSFIKKVKQKNPKMMTMVLTHQTDSYDAIELVNNGLVYRYFRKPINIKLLRNSIAQGIKFYCQNANTYNNFTKQFASPQKAFL